MLVSGAVGRCVVHCISSHQAAAFAAPALPILYLDTGCAAGQDQLLFRSFRSRERSDFYAGRMPCFPLIDQSMMESPYKLVGRRVVGGAVVQRLAPSSVLMKTRKTRQNGQRKKGVCAMTTGYRVCSDRRFGWPKALGYILKKRRLVSCFEPRKQGRCEKQ